MVLILAQLRGDYFYKTFSGLVLVVSLTPVSALESNHLTLQSSFIFSYVRDFKTLSLSSNWRKRTIIGLPLTGLPKRCDPVGYLRCKFPFSVKNICYLIVHVGMILVRVLWDTMQNNILSAAVALLLFE